MKTSKWPNALIVLILLFFAVVAITSESHKTKQFRQEPNSFALKDIDIQQRHYMVEISRQLGVTCTYCHDIKDFKSTAKATHKISKTHMEVVKLLKEKYHGEIGAKVDCYMCHRGQAKPDYKEKLSLTEEH